MCAPSDQPSSGGGTPAPGNGSGTPAQTPDPTPAPQSELSGSASDVLEAVMARAQLLLAEEGEEMPMSFVGVIEADTANSIGLTDAEFNQYVEEGSKSTAALITFAHEIVVLKCKSGAADTVVYLLSQGYDSGKWICVVPDVSFVSSSGDYVLLAASKTLTVSAVYEAFRQLAVVVDNEIQFYDGSDVITDAC
jgi:hypothetical protein